MFLHQHPLGQGLCRVARQNRNARLAEDRTIIQSRSDFMHGAAMFGIARLKRAGMGV